MKVVITGGLGFLGRRLAEVFREREVAAHLLAPGLILLDRRVVERRQLAGEKLVDHGWARGSAAVIRP